MNFFLFLLVVGLGVWLVYIVFMLVSAAIFAFFCGLAVAFRTIMRALGLDKSKSRT